MRSVLLSSLLIAPMTTEFQAKVALLGTLTIVCAARPLIILARERWTIPRPSERRTLAVVTALGVASFAGLIVLAGIPARSLASISAGPAMQDVHVGILRTPGVQTLDRTTANRVAAAAVQELRGSTELVSYRISGCDLRLEPARGQAPPTVEATITGTASGKPFTRTLALALNGTHFVVVKQAKPSTAPAPAVVSKGTPAFASSVHLTNVAPKVGLNFTQDSFHYSLTDDPQAMMGGGVCWIDFNNDGWLDLYAVNSYNDGDLPNWEAHGGLPQSQLFQNRNGHFTNVTKASHSGLRVKGTGCAAADLNGDGYTDLIVTTATGVDLLWNNGNGTFTQGASSAGINPAYDWYSSISVADVNGDGRLDILISGYTNMLDRIQTSIAGFPTIYQGVRDLLYLNEGDKHFKEVGVQAGLESSHFSHGLGSVFTDVNGDGRPDLYVANDEDPNQLYINKPGGALGFHFVQEAKAYGVADKNAGMGVAEGDYNDDGRPDLFITNSRGQPHAAYESKDDRWGDDVYVRDGEVREGARPPPDGRLGRLVGRPEQRHEARPRRHERLDPRAEPAEGHAAAAGAAGSRQRAVHERERRHLPDRPAEDHRAWARSRRLQQRRPHGQSRSTRSAARSVLLELNRHGRALARRVLAAEGFQAGAVQSPRALANGRQLVQSFTPAAATCRRRIRAPTSVSGRRRGWPG